MLYLYTDWLSARVRGVSEHRYTWQQCSSLCTFYVTLEKSSGYWNTVRFVLLWNWLKWTHFSPWNGKLCMGDGLFAIRLRAEGVSSRSVLYPVWTLPKIKVSRRLRFLSETHDETGGRWVQILKSTCQLPFWFSTILLFMILESAGFNSFTAFS